MGYSHHTLKGYKIQTNLLAKHLGNPHIEDVTFEQLKAYLVSQTHLKPSSLAHRVRYLKSLFHWAHDEGYLARNPASRLREPKLGSLVPKALSEENTELLREGCITPFEHALIEFLYTTGCRIGEVHGLNRNAINWETRSVIVLCKGSREREVYFTVKCGIWLKKYLKDRRDNDTALFVTERAPRRMSISQLRHVVKRVAKRSGVEANVYPHILRHSFATHLLNNGAELADIQGYLGHTKADTTRVYAMLSSERKRERYHKFFR